MGSACVKWHSEAALRHPTLKAASSDLIKFFSWNVAVFVNRRVSTAELISRTQTEPLNPVFTAAPENLWKQCFDPCAICLLDLIRNVRSSDGSLLKNTAGFAFHGHRVSN